MRKTVSRARIYRRMGLLAEQMDNIERALRQSKAVQRYWAALAWAGWFAFVTVSVVWAVWK